MTSFLIPQDPAFFAGVSPERYQESPQGGAVPTIALSFPNSLPFAAGAVPPRTVPRWSRHFLQASSGTD